MAVREKAVSRSELAALFGVEIRTVTNWVQAGCPRRMVDGAPCFLLSEVIPWRREKDKAEAKGGEGADEAEERVRKLSADADMAELKRDELRGLLVQANLVERNWERTLGVLDTRMTASRGKWAPKAIGLSSMAEATAFMDALISDLRAAFVEAADELEAEELEPEGVT